MVFILKMLKWLFVMAILLIAALVVINWNDESPSPSAIKIQSILDADPAIPDEENAFVYAMGLAAPRDEDPVRSGAACVAKLNATAHKKIVNLDTDFKCEKAEKPTSSICDNKLISTLLDTCSTADSACEKALLENDLAIGQWLKEESWFLQRYEGLLRRQKWHLTAKVSPWLSYPPYGELSQGRKMLMLKAWHLAGQGQVDGVKRLLNQEARFWRILLSSSSLLIDKMLASGYLGRDFAFGNLVLRRLQAKGVKDVVPDAWQAPLSREELSMEKVMAGEWSFFSTTLQEAEATLRGGRVYLADGKEVPASLLDKVSNYFLLPQATQNEHAEMLLRLVAIFNVPVEDFPQAAKQADAYTKKKFGGLDSWLHPYNPDGHILVAIAAPAYTDFVAAVYDLKGVRRAALATLELREKGVDKSQVAKALEQSSLINPYDKQPFTWDAATGSILFKGLAIGRNEHRFLY